MQELQLKQFRCFQDKTFFFKNPVTIISGLNGSGKSSIIEALFYLSYFKSFRASTVQEMMHAQMDSFFLKATLEQSMQLHNLQIGYSAQKKVIKLNQQPVSSYKEILTVLPTVSLTQYDIELVTGSPIVRRAFIDHALILINIEHYALFKKFRTILQLRNAGLFQGNVGALEMDIWSQKLWEISNQIAALRSEACLLIEIKINDLLNKFFNDCFSIRLNYQKKAPAQTFSEFLLENQELLRKERFYKRSLFGAHLDDIIIEINQKNARIYASAGQQKLIAMLMKLAMSTISSNQTTLPLILIDDFISDFDTIRVDQIIDFLKKSHNQIIITTPIIDFSFEKIIKNLDSGCIALL